MPNQDDHELASRLATAAGEVLVELRVRLQRGRGR